jgi:4-hydroxybenzoate polyprenyltransferase
MLCAISSITYILNDIADMDEDKCNKKNRPLATGQMGINDAILLVESLALLFFMSFIAINNAVVFYMCLGMFTLDLLYIWKLRDIPVVDVATIALKYPLRLLIGFVIIGVTDYFLLIIIYLVALLLALMKRKGEMLSKMKRKVFNCYNEDRLQVLFEYSSLILYTLLIVYFILAYNSFIIMGLSMLEMYWVTKYYANIKGYEEAKSLAILKNRSILVLGLLIIILMILKIHGVNILL